MRLQCAADIGYSKRSASCCNLHLLIWKAVPQPSLPPPFLRLAIELIPRCIPFFMPAKIFSPFIQTHIPMPIPSCPGSHRCMWVQGERTPPGLYSQANHGFWMLLSKPNTSFCQVYFLFQCHLNGQRKQVRIGLISRE